MNHNNPIDISKFDWGKSSQNHIRYTSEDVFTNRTYEKKFRVEQGDIVVDIGATVGEFTFTIQDRKPKHCYVVEPIPVFFDTLKKNLEGNPVSFTQAAISKDKDLKVSWDGQVQVCRTLSFKEFLQQNRLFKIDFLKVDCEGGEYDVFSEENIDFLKSVPKIVAEFHTGVQDFTEKIQKIKANLKNFKSIHFENLSGGVENDQVFSSQSWPEGHPDIKRLGYFNFIFYADNR